jgi:hypothetical protein
MKKLRHMLSFVHFAVLLVMWAPVLLGNMLINDWRVYRNRHAKDD